jgi:hypothetical protein
MVDRKLSRADRRDACPTMGQAVPSPVWTESDQIRVNPGKSDQRKNMRLRNTLSSGKGEVYEAGRWPAIILPMCLNIHLRRILSAALVARLGWYEAGRWPALRPRVAQRLRVKRSQG